MKALNLLFASFLFSPINFRLAGFTLSDYFLLVFIARNLSYFRFGKIFLLQYSISVLGLLVFYQDGDLLRLVFYYKFFIVMFLFGNIRVLKNINTARIIDISRFLGLYLGLYVFYYVFFRESSGYSSLRVNFPFSQDVSTSDAHLYSYVLFILFAIISISKSIVSRLILLLLIAASLLTGSRTGTGMMLLWLIINSNLRVKLTALSVITILLLFYSDLLEGDLISRALNVGDVLSGEDMSLLARLKKWEVVLVQSIAGFGIIPLTGININVLWLDSFYLMYYIYFGIIGLVTLLLWLIIEVTKLTRLKNRQAIAFLLCILISNAATEYILTTRGLLITVFGYLFFMYENNSNNHKYLEASKFE